MAPASGQPEHPRLVSLSRDVERTGRRVDELDGLVRRLGVDVSAIAHHLSTGSPGSGEDRESGVRAWLLIEDRERAEADIDDLILWLDRVYLAYPGATLPTCWLWHSWIVEELWWLRQAHADAYSPVVGSWQRAGDWHDRLRPNVVRRIRQSVVACEVSEHRPGRGQAHPAARAPMTVAADAIAAWAAAGRPDPAPEPTEDHLAESRRFLDEELRRRRR